jgi:flagellar biosynthesis protein FlhF
VIGCIPTKLDEAMTLGTVLDVVVRHKLPLHYIASGQRVPEDLHEVNLEYLLHRTFKPAAKTAPFTLRELEFPALMAGLGNASARDAAVGAGMLRSDPAANSAARGTYAI